MFYNRTISYSDDIAQERQNGLYVVFVIKGSNGKFSNNYLLSKRYTLIQLMSWAEKHQEQSGQCWLNCVLRCRDQASYILWILCCNSSQFTPAVTSKSIGNKCLLFKLLALHSSGFVERGMHMSAISKGNNWHVDSRCYLWLDCRHNT